MTNKNKRQWTIKKRKLITLLFAIMLGVGSIGVAYIGTITPLQIEIVDKAQAKTKNEKPLTMEEQICYYANGEYCELLVKLAKCESNLNPNAINVNKNGSADLGIMQINTIHKDISNSDKFNVEKAVKWTLEKIKKGDLHLWVCSKNI